MNIFNIFSRKKNASEAYVEWNEKTITCYRSNTLIESLAWNNLEAIIIETTDQGPFYGDLFWILLGNNGKGSGIALSYPI